jgi:hypothetical protein
MDKIGVECLLGLSEDHQNPPVEMNREMVAFFLRHFPK